MQGVALVQAEKAAPGGQSAIAPVSPPGILRGVFAGTDVEKGGAGGVAIDDRAAARGVSEIPFGFTHDAAGRQKRELARILSPGGDRQPRWPGIPQGWDGSGTARDHESASRRGGQQQ